MIISPVDQQIPLRHAHRRNRKETVFCIIHLKSLEPHPAIHKEQSSQGQVPSKEKTAYHKCSSRSDPIRSISANMQPAGERKKRRDMLTMICSSPSDPVSLPPHSSTNSLHDTPSKKSLLFLRDPRCTSQCEKLSHYLRSVVCDFCREKTGESSVHQSQGGKENPYEDTKHQYDKQVT